VLVAGAGSFLQPHSHHAFDTDRAAIVAENTSLLVGDRFIFLMVTMEESVEHVEASVVVACVLVRWICLI
jgi:hypothetical protein